MRLRKFILVAAVSSAALWAISHRIEEVQGYTCPAVSIVAVPGDDYWGYAERFCDGNIAMVADDLVRTYGMPLEVGRVIHLPKSDECEMLVTDGGDVYERCG